MYLEAKRKKRKDPKKNAKFKGYIISMAPMKCASISQHVATPFYFRIYLFCFVVVVVVVVVGVKFFCSLGPSSFWFRAPRSSGCGKVKKST